MVSVRYSRSILHKNSIQESVLELFSGLALEKIVESDGVWFAPRERVHPPLMPGERPRCSELCDEGYHALQLQCLGVVLSVAVSQLCLARKLFRRSGSSFLISIFGSPNRTLITVPFGLRTYTAFFLVSPGV